MLSLDIVSCLFLQIFASDWHYQRSYCFVLDCYHDPQLEMLQIYVLGAAHFCDCSYSTRCPHRPAARQTGHRRFSTQDAHPSLPTTLRQRRVTAPSYPTWRPHNLHEIHSLRPLTEIGAPIHSSTVIAEHQESCQVHSLGLSTSDSPSRLFQNAPDCSRVFQNTVLEEETVSSQDGSETSERRERGVYGYKFKPKKQLSTFEKSVICV